MVEDYKKFKASISVPPFIPYRGARPSEVVLAKDRAGAKATFLEYLPEALKEKIKHNPGGVTIQEYPQEYPQESNDQKDS